MPYTTFAAIDVGSYEVSLKIFEVSKKTGIRELDCVRHTIELGAETYRNGSIGHELVNELCEVLIGFTGKMKEYRVSDYTAYATSAVREASNSVLILDQIKLRSGLKVKIISNSEQRFLCYKAIALKENAFNKIIQKGTAIVDVGSGSIQLSLFDKESLVATQNIRLGSLRIRELLGDFGNRTMNFNHLVYEYVDNSFHTFQELYLQKHKIKNIIAVGDNLNVLNQYMLKNHVSDSVSRSFFLELYSSLEGKSVEEVSEEQKIPKEQATLVLPTAMIYYKMFQESDAEMMWLPGIDLCDGIAAEYAERKEKIMPSHDFTNDIIMAARNMASRYLCNVHHIRNVEYLALSIFDSIKKLHGMGKRERLLLQIAVILHTCGEFINMNASSENSYHIILSTEIIGLSHAEREIVASIVKYNTCPFPKFYDITIGYDRETYIKISKLTAILRIANAMDRSHRQKFDKFKITLSDNQLLITANTLLDISLEKGLFNKKADFFEQVYGIRPILKQKRSI